MRHGRTAGLLALVLGLVLGSTYWLRLNLSPSVPRGLYRLTAVSVEVPRGTLVVLPVPVSVQHVWPSWVPLLKPVAGVSGDVVCHQDGRLQVHTEASSLLVSQVANSQGGVDYGPVYREAHGTPLPHLDSGCQTVAAGQVFLASPAPKSMDGRYFGMTPIHKITAQALPVLIWG